MKGPVEFFIYFPFGNKLIVTNWEWINQQLSEGGKVSTLHFIPTRRKRGGCPTLDKELMEEAGSYPAYYYISNHKEDVLRRESNPSVAE